MWETCIRELETSTGARYVRRFVWNLLMRVLVFQLQKLVDVVELGKM